MHLDRIPREQATEVGDDHPPEARRPQGPRQRPVHRHPDGIDDVLRMRPGPRRSTRRPSNGLNAAETRNPNEKAPAVTPRSQPNSFRIGGKKSEKAVRALTPMPIVTNAVATSNQP